MKKIIILAGLAIGSFYSLRAQNQQLTHLASYQTNTEDAAETVAYDITNKRAFFTSSFDNSLTIIDINDPTNPVLFKKVDLASYGAGPNSVALHGNVVAVAVESNPKQDAGKVIFFDLEGMFQNEILQVLYQIW